MSKFNDDFEKEWDAKMNAHREVIKRGGEVSLLNLMYEIELHGYTIDDVKRVILDKVGAEYEAAAKADHYSSEQFNEQI